MTFYDRLIRALLLRRRHAGALGSEDARRAFLRTVILGGATLPFVPGALERIVLSGRRSNHELIRLMASGDYITTQAAQKAFAAFVTAPILQVIEQAPIMTDLFDEYPSHQEASGPSLLCTLALPLDITWGSAPEAASPLPRSEIIHPVHNTWCHGAGRPRHPWDVS